jgi:selenide,water dikinase
LSSLPVSAHENLLVGYNQADDAGVYKLTDDIALVHTVDFFPPIVDDPFSFGRIAAANALSDVYAMGGRPLTGLNILGFPAGKMDESVLTEILRGGADKIVEAGAVVVGGHSVKDAELKYGVAVTGIVHPERIVTNGGARPGDVLFLTKPLGTGLITTGVKRKAVGPELANIATAQMAQLNRAAAELMVAHGVHAATDITGYGILGHAFEMAAASQVSLHIVAEALPLMPQVLELAAAKMIPGGANANRDFMQDKAAIARGLDENLVAVLFDPQTSGGLLIAIPGERAEAFEAATGDDVPVWRIGTVESSGANPIVVT